jgi:hypothetical protein
MKLLYTIAKLVWPTGFVAPDQREVFAAAIPKFAGMRFGEFFNMSLWDDPEFARGWPSLAAERHEDLIDNANLFSTFIGNFPMKLHRNE